MAGLPQLEIQNNSHLPSDNSGHITPCSYLQLLLYTHTIKIKILNTITQEPLNLTPTCVCNLCILLHTCAVPTFKCIAHFLLWRCSQLLLRQCSCCGLHIAPPITTTHSSSFPLVKSYFKI